VVNDDYEHLLGDSNEAMLSAALNYRTTSGSCPALPVSVSEKRGMPSPVSAKIDRAQLLPMIRPNIPGKVVLEQRSQ